MSVRHCGNCDWYMPLAAGSGVCFADGLVADDKDFWDKACQRWQQLNMEGEKRMEEQAQRIEQMDARLANLEKQVLFQAVLLKEQDAALHGLRDGCAERSRTLDSLKETFEEWTKNAISSLDESFDVLSNRLEANTHEQWNEIQGLREFCEERARTLESLKNWTETRLGVLKYGFDDLDKSLGTIIDALSDLTEKMLKELESLKQKQSVIDDGNSVELQRAPADGE